MESRRTVAPPRWRLFHRHWLAILVVAFAAVTLVCGLIGFFQQYQRLYDSQIAAAHAAREVGETVSMPVWDPSLPVYKTFQLFLLNSGAEDDVDHPSNRWLAAARVSTIALLLVLSLAAILNVVDQVRALPRQMTQKDHVVICGLGQIGLQVLDDVLGQTPRRAVVVIESNADSTWLEYARARGAAIVVGDATRADKLREARAEHAAEVFVATGDDGVNLETAAEIGALLQGVVVTRDAGEADAARAPADAAAFRRKAPLRLYVHIADANFSSTLQPNSQVLHRTAAMQVQIFNVPRAVATALVTEEVAWLAPRSSDEVAHFVLLGFGAMGQILAVQLAQLAHFRDLQRCRFTIADVDVRTNARSFVTRFPRFTSWTDDQVGVSDFPRAADAWTWNSHPLPVGIQAPNREAVQYVCNAEFVDFEGGTFGERFARHLIERFADPAVRVRPIVFVCGQQDRENFETAVRLRRLLENEAPEAATGRDVPIFVWLPRQPALAGSLRDATGFRPFGACRAAASYAAITRPLRETLGREIHAKYELHQRAAAPDARPESWESLRDDYRESSRASADSALVKLATLGVTLAQAQTDPAKAPETLAPPGSDAETVLAQMEHNRWLAERLMTDWRYAATGDDPAIVAAMKARRFHASLLPWRDLSPGDQAKDVQQVRTILRACRIAGTE